ncbi:MAG: PaaI family thioesterase, partial [Mycobacterium sp.]|nr:PaaI family thioesterase [Mycobacterium sp.]
MSVTSDDERGGFPRFQVLDEPPGFGRFVTAMRRAQDLAVS